MGSSRRQPLYRVRNWSEYEKPLVQRGSITFWLTIKEVYHLSNRGVEGFVRSLFGMLNLHLSIPDHTTLSKRGKTFHVRLPKKTSENLQLVLDSTGLKIYGEGEMK